MARAFAEQRGRLEGSGNEGSTSRCHRTDEVAGKAIGGRQLSRTSTILPSHLPNRFVGDSERFLGERRLSSVWTNRTCAGARRRQRKAEKAWLWLGGELAPIPFVLFATADSTASTSVRDYLCPSSVIRESLSSVDNKLLFRSCSLCY